MRKLLIVFLLCSVPSLGFGQERRIYTYVTGEDGMYFYIDFDAITRTGDTVFYSTWKSLTPEKALEYKKNYSELRAYNQGNCKIFQNRQLTARTLKISRRNHYKTIDAWHEPTSWKYPTPGSYDHTLLEKACNHKKLTY